MFKLLLKLLFIVVIAVILVAGYLGFVPGLSTIMGANKPKDLNISYTAENASQAYQKSNITINSSTEKANVSVADSVSFQGSHEVNDTYSSEEITAAANVDHWIYNPITSSQIRFNADGSAEASGILNMAIVWSYIEGLGIAPDAIAEAKKFADKIPSSPTFYIKTNFEVIDNQVTGNVLSLTIGKLAIPQNIVTANQDYLSELAETHMQRIPGFYAKSVKIENSQLHFEGSIPDSKTIVTN